MLQPSLGVSSLDLGRSPRVGGLFLSRGSWLRSRPNGLDCVNCGSPPALDRQLERLLARTGQPGVATKPILEINPRHELIVALAGLGDDEQALREEASQLLFDEARILDGELPVDVKAFSQRLTRVMKRCLLRQ